MHLNQTNDPPKLVASFVSQCSFPIDLELYCSLLLGHGLVHHRKFRKLFDEWFSQSGIEGEILSNVMQYMVR